MFGRSVAGMNRSFLLAVPLLLAVPVAGQAVSAPSSAQFDASVARTKQVMVRDPQAALASAHEAVALAAKLPPSPRTELDKLTADWLHGEALIFMNNLGEATPVIGRALRRIAHFSPNTKLHGDLLRARGAIAASTGEVTAALQYYQNAYEVFRRAGEARQQSIMLQDIGSIYNEAGDPRRALTYHARAMQAYDGDPALTLVIINNRAECLRKLGRPAEASASYRAALVAARRLGSPMLLTRIYTNLAGSEAEAGRLGAADEAADQALKYSSHGEAAGWRPLVYGAAARVAADRRDTKRAESFLARALRGADLTTTDLSFRWIHRTAAEVYESLGDPKLALAHAKAFQRLEGEAQQLVASNAAQLMAARFDFAAQNLEISKLKQVQLARDVVAEREKSHARNLLFGALAVAGACVLAILLFAFFGARRSRDAVKRAYATLSDVNAELEKALKVKTEFLATTSHEIRTPLNGILGMTQVLLADRTIAACVRERIEVVHGAGETMKALVDDILDVAKMESGELTIAREPTEIGAVLADAARLWGGQAEVKGLALALDAARCPQRIMGDGPRLRQIVFNLMSNALKFTAQGGVTLFAAAEQGNDGERLVIRVSDTGIGIPADRQADIFEAFRQVDGGTTRQFGGTGLGLAICRRLAEAMGGGIAVESEPGRGSCFIVTLPIERAEADAPDAAAASAGDGVLAATRVVLVDAEPVDRADLRALLAAEAGTVEVAGDMATAIAALAAGAATHLLLGVGGLPADALRDAARAARAAGAQLTLLLSPETAGVSIAEAMTAGATQLVVEPITAADLVAAMKSLYGDEPDGFVAPALLDAAA